MNGSPTPGPGPPSAQQTQEPVSALEFTQLVGLSRGHARLSADFDVGPTHPRVQRRLMDPEILRDLLQRGLRIPLPGNTNHVVTELAGIGLGHSDILASLPFGQHLQIARNQGTFK